MAGREDNEARKSSPGRIAARSNQVSGRLATLSGLALVAGAIPIPLLPDRVLTQLRGAIVHDTCTRHNIGLTTDARELLADANHQDRVRQMLKKGLLLIARRILKRLGPLAPLTAAANAVEVFALGHLLERYLTQHRTREQLRIQPEEAAALRRAIDRAVITALYPSTRPTTLALPEATEDLRDEFTRWIDTVLLTTATVPNYIQRRIEAAFDEVVATTSELFDD